MKAQIIAAFAALLALLPASAAAQPQTDGPPDWWRAHVDFMSRDGGVWVAPNPGNEADPSQPDAFGMQWRASNGGYLLSGRLYAIEDGVAQPDYWTYREFWHPGARRAVLEQWGGPGVYGVGETAMEANRGRVEQTFWLPDGRDWKEGHRTVEDGDVYVTESYDIDDAGNWTLNGSYTWRRAGAG